jgi:hypothetical protein
MVQLRSKYQNDRVHRTYEFVPFTGIFRRCSMLSPMLHSMGNMSRDPLQMIPHHCISKTIPSCGHTFNMHLERLMDVIFPFILQLQNRRLIATAKDGFHRMAFLYACSPSSFPIASLGGRDQVQMLVYLRMRSRLILKSHLDTIYLPMQDSRVVGNS